MQSDTASPKRGSPLPLFGCLFPRKKIPPSDAKPPDGIFFSETYQSICSLTLEALPTRSRR